MTGPAEPFAPGPAPAGRPFVTLSWAQTLDGSIAAKRGERLRISGPESMAMTHGLRSMHDAILVGINTVLADDPRLTVRLVEGPSPRPVVLDSALRLPLGCRLVAEAPLKPWVLYAAGSGPGDAAQDPGGLEERRRALESAGCVCLEAGSGRRVELGPALAALAARGVRSLMAEGGGLVLRSFVESGLVDRYVITVAPVLAHGYNPFSFAVDAPPTMAAGPVAAAAGLRYVAQLRYGADLVVVAEPAEG